MMYFYHLGTFPPDRSSQALLKNLLSTLIQKTSMKIFSMVSQDKKEGYPQEDVRDEEDDEGRTDFIRKLEERRTWFWFL
jgi:hypothetical protein